MQPPQQGLASQQPPQALSPQQLSHMSKSAMATALGAKGKGKVAPTGSQPYDQAPTAQQLPVEGLGHTPQPPQQQFVGFTTQGAIAPQHQQPAAHPSPTEIQQAIMAASAAGMITASQAAASEPLPPGCCPTPVAPSGFQAASLLLVPGSQPSQAPSPIMYPAMPASQEEVLSPQLQGLSAQVTAMAQAAVAHAPRHAEGQQPQQFRQPPPGAPASPLTTTDGRTPVDSLPPSFPTDLGPSPKEPSSPTEMPLDPTHMRPISPTAPMVPGHAQPPAQEVSPTSPAETQEASQAQRWGPNGTPPRKSHCVELGQTGEL